MTDIHTVSLRETGIKNAITHEKFSKQEKRN